MNPIFAEIEQHRRDTEIENAGKWASQWPKLCHKCHAKYFTRDLVAPEKWFELCKAGMAWEMLPLYDLDEVKEQRNCPCGSTLCALKNMEDFNESH